MKNKLPSSFYNPITLTGAAIALISFGLILFLMLLEAVSGGQKPYMGIIAFVVLPTFLLAGLFLIVAGIYREHRREKAGIHIDRKFPMLDLNDPRHRRATVIFSLGTILLLLFSAFGSFKAYEYTDSDEFCGTLCHSVMEPEYTAYQFSPHAKVGCVQCHIGSGADWFVRSKLSGAYQVYSVLFNKYSRPIPTPIENLRPAQETCEQCHWPKHFFNQKKHVNTYYLSDEHNSMFNLNLLMNIGGGNIEAGPTSGIHWHMNIANEIVYAAVDSQRLQIPWIRMKDSEGKTTIFRSTEIQFNENQLKDIKLRRMDCIDCHNRPTHIYNEPATSVNHLMSLGWINRDLPFIKSITVDALERNYRNKTTALDSIRIIISNFYETNYPSLAKERKEEIERTIEEIQKIYSRNYFPEMRVNWKNFPNHIGHMYSPGCFRCHDGKHVSDDGRVLSKDCNVCHTILSQEYEHEKTRISLTGIDYIHPVDIGNEWITVNCSDCHGK